MNRITTLFLSLFLPSYTMHTQTYTIITTHSEPTLLEFNQAIESANSFIEHGTRNLISSLRRVTLSLHFSVIEHEIFLAKKMAPQNTQNRTIFSLPKTTCPWNNARGKNQHCGKYRVYLLPTSKFRFPTPFLVRYWAAKLDRIS